MTTTTTTTAAAATTATSIAADCCLLSFVLNRTKRRKGERARGRRSETECATNTLGRMAEAAGT